MSIEAEPEVQASDIPNYSATPKTEMVSGTAERWLVVKYGVNPEDSALPEKVIDIRKVDMGDQFDLAEIAGSQVDNDVWMSLAVIGLSVQRIDGTPIPRGNLTKASLRNTLKAIGPLGVRAVRRALYEMSGIVATSPVGDQEKAAAGN